MGAVPTGNPSGAGPGVGSAPHGVMRTGMGYVGPIGRADIGYRTGNPPHPIGRRAEACARNLMTSAAGDEGPQSQCDDGAGGRPVQSRPPTPSRVSASTMSTTALRASLSETPSR